MKQNGYFIQVYSLSKNEKIARKKNRRKEKRPCRGSEYLIPAQQGLENYTLFNTVEYSGHYKFISINRPVRQSTKERYLKNVVLINRADVQGYTNH